MAYKGLLTRVGGAASAKHGRHTVACPPDKENPGVSKTTELNASGKAAANRKRQADEPAGQTRSRGRETRRELGFDTVLDTLTNKRLCGAMLEVAEHRPVVWRLEKME